MKKIICVFIILLMATIVNAAVVIQDDFEYVVNRDDSDKDNFVNVGPWSAWKSRPRDSGAYGYTYTTTSIPGFTGSFPGTNSTRVLKSEHLPMSLGSDTEQSDTTLRFWQDGVRLIPNVFYVQMWIYFQYYGDELSNWANGKFIYPCGDNSMGTTCSGSSTDWLSLFRQDFAGCPYEGITAPAGGLYIYDHTMGAAQAPYGCTGDPGSNATKLGPNVLPANQSHFSPNTWYLLRLYHDFSTNNPTYKMWRRTVNETEFTLILNYQDGVTPEMTWTPYSTQGHYGFNFLEMNQGGDCWFYVDDFIIATTEADLPTYGGSTPARKLNNVTGVRVTLH